MKFNMNLKNNTFYNVYYICHLFNSNVSLKSTGTQLFSMPLTTHNFQRTSILHLIMQATFIRPSLNFIIAYICFFFSPVFHHTERSCGRCWLLPRQVQELSLPQTLERQIRVHRKGLLEPQESVVPHLEPRSERRRAGSHASGLHQSVEDEAIINNFIGK